MSEGELRRTTIAGVMIAEARHVEDERGFLTRRFSAGPFDAAGVSGRILQVNHTLTRRRAVIRGMHFQRPPCAETKIVACLRGEVFDVALDLRKHSSTFLQWHGEVLSRENRRALVIPEGVAHGFQTLTTDCELLYLHTAAYEPSLEGGVSAVDPRAGITWPLPIAEMSDRDRSHRFLPEDFDGITV